MYEKSKKNKLSQATLFDAVRKNDEKPASELMKTIAAKVPSKKKIMNDFSPAEQAEIFERIEQNGANAKMLPGKRELTPEEDARRELIRKIKRIAKEMEMRNNSRIILFPSYSRNGAELTWYKMGDFSAWYYTYRMAERMGRKLPTVQKDKDRFYKMKAIVSIKDVDEFIERAMKLNKFEKHEETLDGVHILHMKHALSDDEVATLKRTGEMQKEMMHNVLRPRKAAPEVYLTILMLGRQVMRMTSALGIIQRYEIGDKVAENVFEMLSVYYDYTGGLCDAETTRNEIRRRLFRVRAGMALLGDDEAVKPAKACAIGETVTKIEALIPEIK